jgi:hypothetical protein
MSGGKLTHAARRGLRNQGPLVQRLTRVRVHQADHRLAYALEHGLIPITSPLQEVLATAAGIGRQMVYFGDPGCVLLNVTAAPDDGASR